MVYTEGKQSEVTYTNWNVQYWRNGLGQRSKTIRSNRYKLERVVLRCGLDVPGASKHESNTIDNTFRIIYNMTLTNKVFCTEYKIFQQFSLIILCLFNTILVDVPKTSTSLKSFMGKYFQCFKLLDKFSHRNQNMIDININSTVEAFIEINILISEAAIQRCS